MQEAIKEKNKEIDSSPYQKQPTLLKQEQPSLKKSLTIAPKKFKTLNQATKKSRNNW